MSAPFTPDTTEFLVSWIIEHLAKKGLIDGRQLRFDLESLADLPETSDAERESYQRWIRELWSVGALSSTDG